MSAASVDKLPWEDDEPVVQPRPEPKRPRGRARKAAVLEPESEDESDLEEEPLEKDDFIPFMEEQMLANAPALCRALYPSLLSLVKDKNLEAIKIVSSMLGLVKSNSSGVNIVQNIASIGVGGMASQDPRDGSPRGFESIIRVLEMRDLAKSRSLGPAASMPLPDFERQTRAITIEADVEPGE